MHLSMLYHALVGSGVVLFVYGVLTLRKVRHSRYHVWFALGVSVSLGGLKELTDALSNDWPWCGEHGCQPDLWDLFVHVDAAIAAVCLVLFCQEPPTLRQVRDDVTVAETVFDDTRHSFDLDVEKEVSKARDSSEEPPASVVTTASDDSLSNNDEQEDDEEVDESPV